MRLGKQIVHVDGFLDASTIFVIMEAECSNQCEVYVPPVFGQFTDSFNTRWGDVYNTTITLFSRKYTKNIILAGLIFFIQPKIYVLCRIWLILIILCVSGNPLTQEVVVAGGVAAQCQARHDYIAFLCELHCKVVGFCAASSIGGPCPNDGHALFSLQEFEVAPHPQPFGTILSNIPQQGREQLGALGDFDDGIGHDGLWEDERI